MAKFSAPGERGNTHGQGVGLFYVLVRGLEHVEVDFEILLVRVAIVGHGTPGAVVPAAVLCDASSDARDKTAPGSG